MQNLTEKFFPNEKTILDQTATHKSALVVEGGAMRGIFSAGVLDHFLEVGHTNFDLAFGVSAGALNLASWLAGQRGRSYEIITNFCRRPDFLKMSNLIKRKNVLDLDWLWNISEAHNPINMDNLFENKTKFIAVTTAISSGKPMYVEATPINLRKLLIATSSLPIFIKGFCKIHNELVADGGIADSIPVLKAYEMGATNITVILSRHSGYKMKSIKIPWIVQVLFRKNKALAKTIVNRYYSYNKAIEFISNPPKGVNITVISPPKEFDVNRLTMNTDKLEKGYIMGLEEARKYLNSTKSFIICNS
ncbi:TPA: patatin family protein [Vibrio parahaemolyticus]|nr:patatin family protein [Vibrio parahaemolyticus]